MNTELILAGKNYHVKKNKHNCTKASTIKKYKVLKGFEKQQVININLLSRLTVRTQLLCRRLEFRVSSQ